MIPDEFLRGLPDYLSGNMMGAVKERFEKMLRECPECADLLRSMQERHRAEDLAGSAENVVPAEARLRLYQAMNAVRRSEGRPLIPIPERLLEAVEEVRRRGAAAAGVAVAVGAGMKEAAGSVVRKGIEESVEVKETAVDAGYTVGGGVVKMGEDMGKGLKDVAKATGEFVKAGAEAAKEVGAVVVGEAANTASRAAEVPAAATEATKGATGPLKAAAKVTAKSAGTAAAATKGIVKSGVVAAEGAAKVTGAGMKVAAESTKAGIKAGADAMSLGMDVAKASGKVAAAVAEASADISKEAAESLKKLSGKAKK